MAVVAQPDRLAKALKSATRRAKSDVANKLVSMFLHSLSKELCSNWAIRIEDQAYCAKIRQFFGDSCPYCQLQLDPANLIIEHPDGMNRLRAGLHVPGNILLACKSCNSEKRRDDSQATLVLANTGWESFLSHDESRCAPGCKTCAYWQARWPDIKVRRRELGKSLERFRQFRGSFPEFQRVQSETQAQLPGHLAVLYSGCQNFADSTIQSLLGEVLGKIMIKAK